MGFQDFIIFFVMMVFYRLNLAILLLYNFKHAEIAMAPLSNRAFKFWNLNI